MDKAIKILRLTHALLLAVSAGLALAKQIREHAEEAVDDAQSGKVGVKVNGENFPGLQAALDRMTENLRDAARAPAGPAAKPKYRPKDPPADLDTTPWDDPKTRDRA